MASSLLPVVEQRCCVQFRRVFILSDAQAPISFGKGNAKGKSETTLTATGLAAKPPVCGHC